MLNNIKNCNFADFDFPISAEREELDFSSLEPMIEMGSKNFSSEEGVYSSAVTSPCQPLLDGSESDDLVDELLNEGLKDLGYTAFRPGQVRKLFEHLFNSYF